MAFCSAAGAAPVGLIVAIWHGQQVPPLVVTGFYSRGEGMSDPVGLARERRSLPVAVQAWLATDRAG